MTKIIKKKIHGKESRKLMLEGINEMANVVGSTMGAKGRNVLLDQEIGSPLCINDGVSIVREICFDDPIKNIAAQLIKDAAIKTNRDAGDGTTGSVVLARAIIREGWDAVAKGANPVLFRKELDKAVERVISNLETQVTPVEDEKSVVQIASISVQDEKLGEQIGTVMHKIGASGAIALKPSIKTGVFIEREDGMRLEGQLVGGVVENGDKWETVLADAKVLVLKDSIEDHELETKWLPFVSQFVDSQYDKATNKVQVTKVHVPTFLVIAETLSKRISTMMNSNKDFIKWVWFRPTTAMKNMKEIYKDIAALVGGKVVDEEEGMPIGKMTVEDLGSVVTATVGRHDLILTVDQAKSKANAYLDRCIDVKKQIDNAEDGDEQEQIKERYASLTGGVATIKIAAATDQATNELELRIEDAVNATRSAMEEGVVAGGGSALYFASRSLDEKNPAEAVIKAACEAPIFQILHNAGYTDSDAKKTVKGLESGQGVDVITEAVVNMKEKGIIDPLKVIKHALINASSVAGLLLTSEYAITNEVSQIDELRELLSPSKK